MDQPDNTMAGQTLDTEQFSSEYGIPRATLNTMRSKGKGPAYVKVGRRVYYLRKDIENYLQSKRITPKRG